MTDRRLLVRSVDAPILVIAEGADERRIIYELLIRREPTLDVVAHRYPARTASPDIRIVDTGDRNFGQLVGLNPAIPRFDRVRRLVLVFDAEEQPVETFEAIREKLGASGFPLPGQAWEAVEEEGRTCAIAVLPDGSSTGSLEAMLLEGVASAADGPHQLDCVDEFIRCVGQGTDTLTARHDKRRLFSWLSIQDEPTRFAGEAASTGILPVGTPRFELLIDLVLGRSR